MNKEEKIWSIKNICPDIKTCDVPMTKESFYDLCYTNYKECFLNCSDLPFEWLKKLHPDIYKKLNK